VEIACTFPWLHFIAHSKNHYIEEKKRGFWAARTWNEGFGGGMASGVNYKTFGNFI